MSHNHVQIMSDVLNEYESDLLEKPDSEYIKNRLSYLSEFLEITSVRKWAIGDAEGFVSKEDYKYLIDGLIEISEGQLDSLSYSINEEKVENGAIEFKIQVAFNNIQDEFTFTVNSDWLNFELLEFLNGILQNSNIEERFFDTIPSKSMDQCFSIVFITREKYITLAENDFAVKLPPTEYEEVQERFKVAIEDVKDDMNFVIKAKRHYNRPEEEIQQTLEVFQFDKYIKLLEDKCYKIQSKKTLDFFLDLIREISFKRTSIATEQDFREYIDLLNKIKTELEAL